MAMEDAIQRWVEDTAGMAESDLLRYIALGMIASGVCAAVALMVRAIDPALSRAGRR